MLGAVSMALEGWGMASPTQEYDIGGSEYGIGGCEYGIGGSEYGIP